ncbi:hypothetical protein [Arhodomonas sp. SL1]|uniref:hypothetical protein n=1 Tax=Arhodomonas sp. SL1 TaxID=3425691 RepID=UPI003F881E47
MATEADAPVDRLLAKLDCVRRRGERAWIARCPGHEDHTPSLAIAVRDSGVVLIYCHAGCGYEQVLDAIDLKAADLFPPRLRRGGRGPLPRDARRPPRLSAAEMLASVPGDALVVAMAADELAAGRRLADRDRERLRAASLRLRAAAREVGA